MSVIGLTVSLTHLLTRTRSRHAVCDITMSRDGVAGFRLNAHPQEDGKYSQPVPLSLEQHCGPRFSCWDHISHKGFAPPLSRPSRSEEHTSKRRGEFKLYLNRIRLKFETSAIDSNFMH